FDQCRKTDVAQDRAVPTEPRRVRNRRRRRFGRRSRTFSLGKNIHFDPGLLVDELRPAAGLTSGNFKTQDDGGAEKIVDLVSGDDDVDVLRHSALESMTPNRPTAADYRLAANYTEQVIQRMNDATI